MTITTLDNLKSFIQLFGLKSDVALCIRSHDFFSIMYFNKTYKSLFKYPWDNNFVDVLTEKDRNKIFSLLCKNKYSNKAFFVDYKIPAENNMVDLTEYVIPLFLTNLKKQIFLCFAIECDFIKSNSENEHNKIYELSVPNKNILGFSEFMTTHQMEKNEYYIITNTTSSISFTVRESQCLYYKLRGYSLNEVAKELYLSRRTIENHLQNIKNKMGLPNMLKIIHAIANDFTIYQCLR